MRTPSSLGLLVAVCALSFGNGIDAQRRPGLPERRCARITLEVTAPTPSRPRDVGLRVVNNDPGGFGATLSAEVVVEREVGGAWVRASVAGMRLRERCEGTAPARVTVAPQSALAVAPWTGMFGDGQCFCTRCFPAPAGRYRFRVNSAAACLAPNTVVSEAFTLAPPQ